MLTNNGVEIPNVCSVTGSIRPGREIENCRQTLKATGKETALNRGRTGQMA